MIPLVKEKILFLINPVSGSRYKGNLPKIIKELADTSIFEVEIIITGYKGEATAIVRQKLADNYRLFVAVGGDGTVNEIAKALINTPAILGIIPVGSGNGLARHLRIPLQPQKAMQIINELKYEAIDYGLINDLPFFCTCGIGFDALIGEKFEQYKGRGLANYLKAVISEYFNYQSDNYQLSIDDQTRISQKAFLITFANASQYGNNAYIAPNADIRDGKLDLCILSPFGFFKAPLLGIRLFSGNIGNSPLMTIQKAVKVTLERASEGIIHIDGETRHLGKHLEISLVSNGLKVIVP